MKPLNIGVLAHVDAGKTSLTERLLYQTGAIDRLGSVDGGTTQTDTSELERQRGITVSSAVVSFTAAGRQVNVVDTPGHPDFIAEVERALDVLDGVVLVISAVEGVQPQTRILMRALQRMQLPTLIFVNKIDRAGARYEGLLADIDRRLTARAMPMQSVAAVGRPEARVANRRFEEAAFDSALTELLADGSDAFLAAYLGGPAVMGARRLRDEFAAQVAAASVYPTFFGSAITGEGVDELVDAIVTMLPSPHGSGDRTSGTVFKIERDAVGSKVAYLRLYGGALSVRQRVPIHRVGAREVQTFPGKVTRLRVFAGGKAVDASTASAGDIVEVFGLRDVQIGDQLGEVRQVKSATRFATPILRTVVQPRRDTDRAGLAAALRLLAEQDPLIDVRNDDGQETSVRLYGEVQKQVIGETLATKFGIDARFSESEIIYRERPIGVGEAVEAIDKRGRNEFFATIGIRVEPGPMGSGVVYRLGVELGSLPASFHAAIEETVRRTLGQGLFGWEVTDCLVTLTHSGYASPISTAADFRDLTPLLLLAALRRAGTAVFEPMSRFELEAPADAAGSVSAALAELGATAEQLVTGETSRLAGSLPSGAVHRLESRLGGLTHGEGILMVQPGGERQLRGPAPIRARIDGNPLNRDEYLSRLRSGV